MLRFGDNPRGLVLGAVLALGVALGSAATASSPVQRIDEGASATIAFVHLRTHTASRSLGRGAPAT